MYKRDLITSEIEKLAQVLAKILGLKSAEKLAEAEQLFAETMANSFSLPIDLLHDEESSGFENWLNKSELPPEKLDSLGEFLYYELGVSEARNKIIAPKLNLVYEQISNKHKIVHLVNMHRQKIIQQYL